MNRIRSELENVQDFHGAYLRQPIIDEIQLGCAITAGAIFAEFFKLHVCHFQNSPLTSTFEFAVWLLQGAVFPETCKIST